MTTQKNEPDMDLKRFSGGREKFVVSPPMMEQEFYRIMRGEGYFDQIRFRYDFFHKKLKEVSVWRLLVSFGAGMYSRPYSFAPVDIDMSLEDFSKKYIRPLADAFLIEE